MTWSNLLYYTLRGVWREWSSGELTILLIALVIAVGSVTSVGFFTSRMSSAIKIQSTQLLGGDLAIRSTAPIPVYLETAANQLGLTIAHSTSFRSILVYYDKYQLAEVKAVSGGYPLRGQLQTSRQLFTESIATHTIPQVGEAWADARLMTLLGLGIGDELQLGETSLRLTQILTFEPDRGGDIFTIAPRLLINRNDVGSSKLVHRGSRVDYKLLIAGGSKEIQLFTRIAKDLKNIEILNVEDARPELRTAIRRADQFLGLAALMTVMIAGAAIAVACRRYVQRRLDTAALMRCFGANQRTIVSIFVLQILVIGFLGCSLGCLLGYFLHWPLAYIYEGLIVNDLPNEPFWPALMGIAVGTVTLFGFSIPPILGLRNVPPIRVLRRDIGELPKRLLTVHLGAFLTLCILIQWQAKDIRLTSYIVGGSVAVLALSSLAAWILVKLVGKLRSRAGVAWRFGISNLSRRASSSTLQVVALSLGLMMLLLLSIVHSDIFDDWVERVPPDAPNFFLINIPPQTVGPLRKYLTTHGVAEPQLYPMIRGRLKSINGVPITAKRYAASRAKRLSTREFNLSWADTLKKDNRLVSGNFWSAEDHKNAQFSIELDLAKTLGIALNDSLEFTIAGSVISGKVTSLRHVEWDSFEVNFFVVTPKSLLKDHPTTFISSFHLPTDKNHILVNLIRTFPSVTVLDVDALLESVRGIMSQSMRGVQYVFIFSLIAGIVVLISTVQSTMDERKFETAILRTLGASSQQLRKSLIAEFFLLGLLAGTLAAGSAITVGMLMADWVFELSYKPTLRIWLYGGLGGAIGVMLVGLVSARKAISEAPIETLRQL